MNIIDIIKKNDYVLFISLGISGYGLVIFFSGIFSVNSTLLAIVYRAIYLFGSLTLIIRYKIHSNLNSIIFKVIFLFWVLLTIRIVFDTFIYPKPLHFTLFKYYAFAYGVTFLPSMAYAQNVNKKIIFRSAELSTFFLFIIMLSTLFFPKYTIINLFLRLGTHYFHPITIGHLAVTSILLSMYVIISKKRFDYIQIFHLINIFVSFLVLLLTKSRGPLLALAIVLFVSFISSGKKIFSFFNNKKYFYSTLFLICLLPLAMFQRMNYTISFGDARLVLWKESIKQFKEFPYIGSSLEILKYNTYPHNLFLEGFMSTGVLGGVLISVISIYTLYLSIKLIHQASYKAVIGILYLQVFVGAMFSLSIIGNSLFWYLTFLTLSNKPLLKDNLKT